MKLFNKNRQCLKCGSNYVTVKYIKRTDIFLRECSCGYKWKELPLDRPQLDSEGKQ